MLAVAGEHFSRETQCSFSINFRCFFSSPTMWTLHSWACKLLEASFHCIQFPYCFGYKRRDKPPHARPPTPPCAVGSLWSIRTKHTEHKPKSKQRMSTNDMRSNARSELLNVYSSYVLFCLCQCTFHRHPCDGSFCMLRFGCPPSPSSCSFDVLCILDM